MAPDSHLCWHRCPFQSGASVKPHRTHRYREKYHKYQCRSGLMSKKGKPGSRAHSFEVSERIKAEAKLGRMAA